MSKSGNDANITKAACAPSALSLMAAALQKCMSAGAEPGFSWRFLLTQQIIPGKALASATKACASFSLLQCRLSVANSTRHHISPALFSQSLQPISAPQPAFVALKTFGQNASCTKHGGN